MALLGKRFQNAVGAGVIAGMSAVAPLAHAQTSTSDALDSLPNTPITTLAVAANTNEAGNASLTESANTAASRRSLSKSERNEMAAEMEIASGEHADTSYAYLMDNDSTGTGLYRLWLPERTDDMPADVVQREIDRLSENAIVLEVYYTKGNDPHQRKQFSDDQRSFGRTMAQLTAQVSDTPVVLLEICAHDASGFQFYDDMKAAVANNKWGAEQQHVDFFGRVLELANHPNPEDRIKPEHWHLTAGALHIPGESESVPFSHEFMGETVDDRNMKAFRVLGGHINAYDGSFKNLGEKLAADHNKGPDLALNTPER